MGNEHEYYIIVLFINLTEISKIQWNMNIIAWPEQQIARTGAFLSVRTSTSDRKKFPTKTWSPACVTHAQTNSYKSALKWIEKTLYKGGTIVAKGLPVLCRVASAMEASKWLPLIFFCIRDMRALNPEMGKSVLVGGFEVRFVNLHLTWIDSSFLVFL